MKKIIATLLIPAAVLSASLISAPAQALPAPIILADASDVSAIAQDFVSQLGQENYGSALGSYSSGSGVSTASLQQTWQDMVAVNGALQGQVSAEVVGGSGSAQVVVVTCEFEQGMRDVVVNFVDGQIVDFSVAEG
jgi:hypothetical protein